MNKLLIITVLLGLAGCSNRAVYENMRIHERNECFKEPPSLYEECLERVNKPFDRYERERKELLEHDERER